MKRIWKGLSGLLLALLAAPALAQDGQEVSLNRLYDLDSASFIYCVSLGSGGQMTGGEARGRDYNAPQNSTMKIKTTGAATAVTSNTASSGSLNFVEVGDLIAVVLSGKREERVVTAKADDDNITVNANIDLTGGFHYTYRDVSCATGATAGDIPVRDLNNYTLTAHVNQMNATSIDVQIECRHANSDFLVVASKNIVAGGDGDANFLSRVFFDESWESCRVGYKVNTDDGDDTGANAEQVNAYLSGKGVVK